MTKLTVPTCEASGQPPPVNCAPVHACSPFATPGDSVVPTGSTISARRTWAWPAGSVSATVAPLGTTRCVVSSVADSDGANGTWSQPVGVKEADCVVSASIVVVAGAHDVGSVMKLASRVRSSALMGSPPVCSCAIVESSPPSGRRVIAASLRTSGNRPSSSIAIPSRAGSPGSGSRL